MIAISRSALPGLLAAAALSMALAAGAACSSPTPTPEPTPTATPTPAPTPSPTPDDTDLSGILATTDLSVGSNRVAFLLLSPRALVNVPQVSLTSTFEGDAEPSETATAAFYQWPFGTRGNYVTQLEFDRAGEWELFVEAEGEDGSPSAARILLHVKDESFTPAVGSPPPMDANRTAADVAGLDEITSWSTPDPDLYQATIPQLAGDGMPSVVVFASPALCTSPTCGPQVETVSKLKDEFTDNVSFVHVEVYDNPHEIQGDLTTARYSPLIETWGLSMIEDYLNESFVFILDRDGRIDSKYEGYASFDELVLGLLRVL